MPARCPTTRSTLRRLLFAVTVMVFVAATGSIEVTGGRAEKTTSDGVTFIFHHVERQRESAVTAMITDESTTFPGRTSVTLARMGSANDGSADIAVA